jgi:dihydrofolate synthase/folylpolyglutamate synthase
MAFNYFAQQQVDIAVIEVGLGGRLDCTNIITPELSIITNISFDHTQFLGGTLADIAGEKAGIIKPGIPIVIGETTPETKEVFSAKAESVGAPITFAEEEALLLSATPLPEGGFAYQTASYGTIEGELGGDYQKKNTNTLLSALEKLKGCGIKISDYAVRKGFTNVCTATGFTGRWQTIGKSPHIVCDAGHNIGGIKYVIEQLERESKRYTALRIVFGMVNDKDISAVLAMMPANAEYYFTQASIKRAMPAEELQAKAAHYGLKGDCYPTVEKALQAAEADSAASDFIFVGGSCFIVADLLTSVNA